MRVSYVALLVAAVLLASANAWPKSKLSTNHERRARSLVFTGEPPKPRFDPKYTSYSSVQKGYSPDQPPPRPEFSEHFDGQFHRNSKDYQVDTNNVDEYPDGDGDGDGDGDRGQDRNGNDYDGSRKDHHLISHYDHAEEQKILDVLKGLLRFKDNEKESSYEDDDDDDENYEDEDEDEDEDVDEDEDADEDKNDNDVFHSNGKDFEGINNINEAPRGNRQEADIDVEYIDGKIVKNPQDYHSPRFSQVPKTENYYEERFYGQDDVDEDFDAGYDLPKDKGQDSWNQDADASDKFADSDEFDFHKEDSWKDQGNPWDKTPNQDADASDEFADSDEFDFRKKDSWKDQGNAWDKTPNQGVDASDEFADRDEFDFDKEDSWKDQGKAPEKIPNQDADDDSMSNDVDVQVPQQEPDGRGVIEPRVGNLDRSSDHSFDISPGNVERWERSDLASGRYQPDDNCVDICDSARRGGKNSARFRSLCNCNGDEVRHVKK